MNLALHTCIATLLLAQPISHAAEHSGHNPDAPHDHGDNPVLIYGEIDRLEMAFDQEENEYVLEGQSWIGKDLDKFWLKADLELHQEEVHEAQLQALYSRAVSAYWDLQLGLRSDIKPSPSREWLVVGVHGLAPYWFEVDAALFFGSQGRTSAQIKAEYEMLITQRLALSPEVSITGYAEDDEQAQTGAGVATITTGLRLSYELRREFAPYLGVNWQKHYGQTATFLRQQQEPIESSQWVMGIHAWF